MDNQPLISIVSPVYQAADIVEALVHRVSESVADLGSYEIVLVDDRSPDDSWIEINRMCCKFAEVRGIRLSRNFGQHAAIAAGLRHARGDYVVVMDCDLQDNPGYIATMLAAARRGADVVLTERPTRQHSHFRNVGARMYNRAIQILSGRRASLGQGSYSLLTRKVVDAYLGLNDFHAHYLAALSFLGFEQATIEVDHAERLSGKSSYTLGKLARHAVDGIVSQSVRLLYLAVSVGMGLFLLSMVGVLYLVVSYFVRGALPGFTSLGVIVLLTSGVILMSIGVVGVYLGRVFEQVKGRPRYVVDLVVGAPEIIDDSGDN
jgi:dolichol-phosphate mannosyltransferase